MIRYDWLVLREIPVTDILKVLSALVQKGDFKQYPVRILMYMSKFKDLSPYLLNPDGLILNRHSYTSAEIFIYLELAALRSYTKYKQTGSTRLPTDYIAENFYPVKQLKMNTLLDVTDEEIIFKYEES